VLAALAAGSLIFYAGWKMAAPHLFEAGAGPAPYSIAAATVLGRISSALSPESAGKWLVYLAEMLFWFSPFALALLARPVLKRGAQAPLPGEVRFLYFAGLFYFTGYFFIGGLNHGFPRYQMGVWPLLAFLTVYGSRAELAGFIEKGFYRSAGIAALAVLPAVILLPDPLRLLNTGLKGALASGSGTWLAAAGLAAVSLYYLFLIWLYSRGRERDGFASLMTAVLAFYLVTGLAQMRAPYLTSYEYGAAGKAEVAAGLRTSVPAPGRIFATPGLLYYIRPGFSPAYGTGAWSSAEAIKRTIVSDQPEAVVLGTGSNTLWQLQLFRSDPGLSALMAERYTLEKIGTFQVWRKRTRPENK
jgi:hypothetical protein